MDMSALLNAPVAGPLSTVVKVCQEGEYKAVVDDGDKWVAFRDGDATKNLSPMGTILFSILDEGVRKHLGREKVLVPMTFFLDVTESGAIDTSEGKNVALGRLFEAAGVQNTGATFGDRLNSLKGKGPFIVKVAQRADKNDPSVKYAEIRKVAKLT